MHEHHAAGPIAVQTVSGRVRVHAASGKSKFLAGMYSRLIAQSRMTSKRLMFNAQYGAGVGEPTPDALGCLMEYGWPGNVRELRNFVEAVFIDPPAGAITMAHIPESFRRILGPYARDGEPERERLMNVLRQTRWNKKQAAAELLNPVPQETRFKWPGT